MEMYAVTLEDGRDFFILDTLEVDNNKYLFLSNEDEEIAVRKVLIENNTEVMSKLDSKEELEKVMTIYSQKIKEKKDEK